ncbi:MAG: hypothetical protein V3W34_04400 [Phycisphaerae bacterium]
MSRKPLFFLTTVLLVLSALPSAGAIVYVDADAGGANNGSSWTDAFVFLQDGLDAAMSGDEIWVAEGIYHPDDGVSVAEGDRNATFQLINGVAVYGGFNATETMLSQRDPATNVSTLSGDLAGDDTPLACVNDSPDCDSNGSLYVDGFCIIAQNNSENSYHVVTREQSLEGSRT